jgi:hypothetical protein
MVAISEQSFVDGKSCVARIAPFILVVLVSCENNNLVGHTSEVYLHRLIDFQIGLADIGLQRGCPGWLIVIAARGEE